MQNLQVRQRRSAFHKRRIGGLGALAGFNFFDLSGFNPSQRALNAFILRERPTFANALLRPADQVCGMALDPRATESLQATALTQMQPAPKNTEAAGNTGRKKARGKAGPRNDEKRLRRQTAPFIARSRLRST